MHPDSYTQASSRSSASTTYNLSKSTQSAWEKVTAKEIVRMPEPEFRAFMQHVEARRQMRAEAKQAITAMYGGTVQGRLGGVDYMRKREGDPCMWCGQMFQANEIDGHEAECSG